eukprot:g19988.t1
MLMLSQGYRGKEPVQKAYKAIRANYVQLVAAADAANPDRTDSEESQALVIKFYEELVRIMDTISVADSPSKRPRKAQPPGQPETFYKSTALLQPVPWALNCKSNKSSRLWIPRPLQGQFRQVLGNPVLVCRTNSCKAAQAAVTLAASSSSLAVTGFGLKRVMLRLLPQKELSNFGASTFPSSLGPDLPGSGEHSQTVQGRQNKRPGHAADGGTAISVGIWFCTDA